MTVTDTLTPHPGPLGSDGHPSSRDTILGMIIVAASTALLVGAGVSVQWAGGSVLQLIFGSYVIQNIISILWWKYNKPRDCVNWYGDPPNRANIWFRGLLYFIEAFCWFKGLELVPLGDAEAIIFLSPLLTVFLARVLLHETLPKLYPLTTFITLIGLLFIAQPSWIFSYFASASTSSNVSYQELSWLGISFLIVMALAWSVASLLVRTAPTAHWLQLNYVSSLQAAYIWTPLLAVINHIIWLNAASSAESGNGNGTPQSNSIHYSYYSLIDANDFKDWDWGWKTFLAMFVAAFCEYFAMVGKIVGYQLGEATKVAWMEYFDIVFAFIFQAWIFGRIPNIWELIGAFLLILTCCISFLEEKCFPRGIDTRDSEAKEEESEKLLSEPTEAITSEVSKCDSAGVSVIDLESSETVSILKGLQKSISNVLSNVTGSDTEDNSIAYNTNNNSINANSEVIDIASSVQYGSLN